MKKCAVRLLTDSECHKQTFSNSQFFYYLKDLKSEDILFIKYLLSHYQFDDKILEKKICNFHKLQFVDYYCSLQCKCCDPFQKHKKI